MDVGTKGIGKEVPCALSRQVCRVGQNRIYTPSYKTTCFKESLPILPYVHCKYMVLANPTRMN